MSSGAYDEGKSIAVNGVSIQAPNIPSPSVNINTLPSAPANTQEAMVQQLRQRTGMNQDFATMCLTQNGWDFEVALKNFEEIKGTIPAEAFQ
jgi:nuclear RNA export factor